MTNKGLIHLYHGDGKGKTTAAIGLALRALAAGRRVLVIQFFKNGLSGEIRLLRQMEHTKILAGTTSGRFFWDMDDLEKAETRALHDSHIDQAAAWIREGEIDFLILDELLSAWNQDIVDQAKVLDLIDNRPVEMEVCYTGRGPAEALIERADYITNMQLERHPFEQGIDARMGIEF